MIFHCNSGRSAIQKMTTIMQHMSVRGNKAYDCFRVGLKQINAPDHVMKLLPDFANEAEMREAEAFRLVNPYPTEISRLLIKLNDEFLDETKKKRLQMFGCFPIFETVCNNLLKIDSLLFRILLKQLALWSFEKLLRVVAK